MILPNVSNNTIRIGIIGASFLTVTAALILLQPDSDTTADVPLAPETETVTRAQTADILGLIADTPVTADSAQTQPPKMQTVVTQASVQSVQVAKTVTPAQAPDSLTAGVLASLGAPIPKAPEVVQPEVSAEDQALRNLTSGVLSGLSGARPFTTNPTMQQLVTQALSQGQSDDYIEAMINAAADAGSIVVPVALRTNEGRVDTDTLLADLVRKSDPDGFEKPKIVSGENGVEVRVVQRAGETRQYNFYTVQAGDSLGAIAHRFYGDAALYTAIFDANRQFISRPDRIRVGQRLTIPSDTTSG